MLSNGKKRGAIFSSDLMAAVVIFIIAFGVIYATWNSILGSTVDVERREMELTAMRAAEELVMSPGYPSNWEKDGNAVVIGLVRLNRRIDSAKLNALLGMDYEMSRERMGIAGYDYMLILNRSGVIKSSPSAGAVREIVSVKRVVDYNGEDILELTLWQK